MALLSQGVKVTSNRIRNFRSVLLYNFIILHTVNKKVYATHVLYATTLPLCVDILTFIYSIYTPAMFPEI